MTVRKEIRENTYCWYFDSVQSLYEEVGESAKKEIDRVRGYLDTNKKVVDWYGVSTGEKVLEMAVSGWSEGLTKIKKALAEIELPQLTKIKRRRVRSDFGDEVDMQMVWSGKMDRAWSRTRRVREKCGKRTPNTIIANFGENDSVKSSDIFWRGAVSVRLAEALEQSGRPCRIVIYSYGKRHVKNSMIVCESKHPGNRLATDNLAYQTALSGFLRIWDFACVRKMVRDNGESSQELGTAMPNPELVKSILGIGEEDAIVVPQILSKFQAQDFLRHVTGQIENKII